MKSKIIATYFEAGHGMLSLDFDRMYRSWKFTGADQTTDLLVATPDPTLEIFGKRRGFPEDVILVKVKPPCNSVPAFHRNRFMNSIGFLLEKDVRSVLSNYDTVLKTDLDVFLLPGFKNWEPEEFVCGRGAYCNDQETRDRIVRIAGELGMVHQGIHNIGATFMCDPTVLEDISERTWEAAIRILEKEFPDGEGKWPGWYAGVASMYASEIAVNDVILTPSPSKILDMESSNEYAGVDSAKVAHCWHTDRRFSKFWHFNGKYRDLKAEDFDPATSVSNYCMHIALLGAK